MAVDRHRGGDPRDELDETGPGTAEDRREAVGVRARPALLEVAKVAEVNLGLSARYGLEPNDGSDFVLTVEGSGEPLVRIAATMYPRRWLSSGSRTDDRRCWAGRACK
jgi:hypothetical protein